MAEIVQAVVILLALVLLVDSQGLENAEKARWLGPGIETRTTSFARRDNWFHNIYIKMRFVSSQFES